MIRSIPKWWEGLSSRERLIARVGAGFACLSLAYLTVVDPMVDRLAVATHQTAKKQKFLHALIESTAEYKDANLRLSALEGPMGVDTKNPFSLLSFLEAASKSVQIRDRIANMQPQATTSSERYKESAVEIRFEGIAWPQLLSLLTAIEGSSHMVKVTRLQVKPRYETPYLLDANLLTTSYEKIQ